MARIEILVEEPSAETCLREILPQIVPEGWVIDQNYFIRKHQGKSDLQKSIPSKVRVYSNWHEPIAIIILHDQDSTDCVNLKDKIRGLCNTTSCRILIRIVCRELESWYLGDMDAIERAYPKFKADAHKNKSKFRVPDTLNAKYELKLILPEYREISSSHSISSQLRFEDNKSESFHQFISGAKKIFESMTP